MQTTSAAAPSPGEQSMYCVSGCASICEPRISSADRGFRRHAWGVSEPFANAFSATCANVAIGMSWSYM